MKKYFNQFCSEPYRVLFPMAIGFGIFGVGLWFAYGLGFAPQLSKFFHSSIQAQAYMGCFIFGFLLTALPRFSSSQKTQPLELIFCLTAFITMVTFLLNQFWIGSSLCFLALLLFFANFAARRFFKKGQEKPMPPIEFIWIPIALVHGALGAIFVILDQLDLAPNILLSAALPLIDQGFLFCIVLGVGGFLAPRIMGLFEPAFNKIDLQQVKVTRKKKATLYVFLGAILLSSFFIEAAGNIWVSYLIRALVITLVLIGTKAWPKPPKVKEQYVFMVWVSFWMIFIGVWSLVLFPPLSTLLLHLVFIGGFSLMTFAVGTMVVLSHAGEVERLRKPLWILRIVNIGIALSLGFRFLADFHSEYFFRYLALSASAWLIAAISWLLFILPLVVKIPADGAFDDAHERAKKNIQP